jgi:hypothetical protein
MLHDILILLIGCVIFVAPTMIMDALDPRNKRK